ncbi:MAG TPA: response regulator [Bdellovibrionota bacterium]|nr:response regulator [Bdellovibrionota bacterium]
MAGKKLLVADDSLTIQKVIRLALSHEGYEIQTVSDGDDAIQQISLFRPAIVLIDVSLPGKTAFDVKRAINGHDDLKGVRFVLMSSAFEKIDEEQLTELTFDGRLTKPFDPAHLRQVLSGVLSQASATSSTQPTPPAFAPPPPPPAQVSEEIPSGPPPGLIAEEDNYGPKYVPAPSTPEERTQPSLRSFSPPEPPPAPAGIPPRPPGFPPSSFPPMPPAGFSPRRPELPKAPQRPEPPKASDSLWEEHETHFDLPPAPPPPPPPQAASNEGADSDIRRLTESTIRMSGLDDFEWSVNEPSLKPPPAFGEEHDTTFDVDASDDDLIAPPPPPPMLTPPRPAAPRAAAPAPQATLAPLPSASPSAPPPPQAPQLDHAEVERIVRKQVQETLERLAQKIIPEVAEKLIKQEIHRMLSEHQ